MTISAIGTLLVYVAYLAFAARRLMTYLHMFQQDEYDRSRFLSWMARNRAFDVKLSLALLALFVLWFILPGNWLLFLLFATFLVFAALEKDPRKESKKKLVMTQRAQRVFFVALVLAALMGTWCFVVHISWLWIINIQLLPMLLVVANIALQPFENYVQKKFWDKAHHKLQTLKPVIIGITGSFGKTSVKHILGHVLKSYAPTLITPGSVNTPMGVTRIIREQLEENHKFFVVEMGAYGPGSIERLCRLAPPDMGIITAIGHAHYERFKTIENVAQAKFELAEAVLVKKGHVIVHEKTLEMEYARAMTLANKEHFIAVGNSEVNELCIDRIEQNVNGLDIVLRWHGQPFRLQVPLYGIHHGMNAALAFAAGATLGIPPDYIVTALKSTPQITHRLEVKKPGDGTILIDDAFNSNPLGFASALQLLPVLAGDAGRKILITPGMVELGAHHDEAHEKIGRLAGEICDVALVVQAKRIPGFVAAFRETGPDKELIEVDSFAQASAWLDKNRKNGDVILIENDLPDIYERALKL